MKSFGSISNSTAKTEALTAIPRVTATASTTTTWEEMRRKACQRLSSICDPARNRHKPVSLQRQESRRSLEQFLDLEYPNLSKYDRTRLIDDTLADAIGLGPLEELFRDESVLEILILAPHQVIVRRGENWLPTSNVFRDSEHYRRTITRMIDQSEPVILGSDAKAGVDVKLGNGFRAVAVVPPSVMDLNPFVTFVRAALSTNIGNAPANRSTGAGTPPPSGSGSSVFSFPPTRGSSVIASPGSRSSIALGGTPTNGPKSGTNVGASSDSVLSSSNLAASGSTIRTGSEARTTSNPSNDPYSRIRTKLTQRLISKFAAAGIYDVQRIPNAELVRIVSTMVEEANTEDRLELDVTEISRLSLEILTAMQA
jgi:pilus assembly protein CpaF